MIDPVGQLISHYRILGQLGQGGMGVVYLAEDLNIGRKVVLKLLKGDLAADPQMAERFHREARACAAVVHPNITTIYEVDRHEGSWFICMEYVEGQTLRSRLRQSERLTLAMAVSVACGAADALGAAHQRGIVHRDMKPENIMLTPSGQVKVLDFGLAAFTTAMLKPLDLQAMQTGVDRLTLQGMAIGTLHYMSPEQTRGSAVTPASDVFSLGAVLYEMVTGQPPFRGSNALEVMHAIAYDAPAPMAAKLPSLPAELDLVVRRALRKDPDSRFPTGGVLHAELTRLLHLIDPGAAQTIVVEPRISSDSIAQRVESAPTKISTPAITAGLIGRERELRILVDRLERAIGGEGSLVLVQGEAGIGKTRLVSEVGRLGEEGGARYLVGRCLFREGGLPYHPFIEAAGRLITDLGLDDADAFDGWVRQRMPALAGRLPILKSFLHVGGQESAVLISDKEHLLDAISALFLAFARERPMILVIDDLHWADEATLDLLLYIVRNCRHSRGLIIGTYRPEEVTQAGGRTHPLARVLDRMSAGDLYVEIKLSRLGRAETGQIIAATMHGARMPPEFVDLLHGETAGNPFYVLETLKLLVEDGTLKKVQGNWRLTQSIARVSIPGRVHDVVTRRLSRVSEADREMLEIASAEGMVFHSDTIATCLGAPRLKVLGALQRAEKEHHIIHAEEDGYTFDHPLIREVLYEAIIPELRREYHRLMGDYLSGNRRGRPGEEAAIAYQYLEAGHEEAALPFLLDAGDRARRLYANAEAMTALNRAEAILTRMLEDAARKGTDPAGLIPQAIRLYKERGRLKQRLGETDLAMSDYRVMQRIAVERSLIDRQAHALSLMAHLYHETGDYDRAFESARRSQELALAAGDKRSLSNGLRVEGALHFYRGEYDDALRAHQASIDIQKEIGDLAGYAENLNKVGNIHLTKGESDKAEAVYQTALALGRQSGHRLAEAEALNNLAVLYYYGGDAEAALAHLDQCLAIKKEIGDKRSLARSMGNVGMVHEMLGDLSAAVATHQESLALIREINDQGSIVTGLNNLTSVYCRMGRYAEASRASEESLAISEAIGDRWITPNSLNSLGRVRLWLNMPLEAEKLSRRALEMSRQQGHRLEECASLHNLGAALAATGRVDEGMTLLRQARELARELKARDEASEAIYVLGTLHAERGEAASVAECARELEELAAVMKSRETRTRRLHLAGVAALLEGRMEDAAALLHEGADLAAEIGLREYEWRLRSDLARALGETPGAASEMARAAGILHSIASQTGLGEMSATYLADPLRQLALRGTSMPAPAGGDSRDVR